MLLKICFLGISFMVLAQISSVSASPRNAKLSKHPVLLVVSYDGFRYDYMTKADMPHLRSLIENGVTAPFMRPQFPSKTFPNHQSIATGLYPDVHGITDNVVFDPLYNTNLSGYKDDPEFWNYHPQVLPFWIRNEQAGDGRYSGTYMWAGSSQGYGVNSTLLPTYVIRQYNESVPWEDRVNTVISWITNEDYPANVVFLYHEQPDSTGHYWGTEANETLVEIEKTDNRTGHLINRLKEAAIFDDINIIIVSDHGMETVTANSIINITAMLDGKVDDSKYFRHGGSPLYNFRSDDNATLSKLYDILSTEAAKDNSHFKAMLKKDANSTGLNYGTSRRIMEILLLADEGYAFDDINLNPVTGVSGVHGYDNRAMNMSAFFAAHGPLFKKNFMLAEPFNNIDLFSLFHHIMSINNIAPNNGTLGVLAECLAEGDLIPTTSEKPGDGNDNGCSTISQNMGRLWLSIILLALLAR